MPLSIDPKPTPIKASRQLNISKRLSLLAGETKGLKRATLTGRPLTGAATSVRRGHLENRSSVDLGDIN
jgi:hypothetical protein